MGQFVVELTGISENNRRESISKKVSFIIKRIIILYVSIGCDSVTTRDLSLNVGNEWCKMRQDGSGLNMTIFTEKSLWIDMNTTGVGMMAVFGKEVVKVDVIRRVGCE